MPGKSGMPDLLAEPSRVGARNDRNGHGPPALSPAGTFRNGAVKRPRPVRAAVTRMRQRPSPLSREGWAALLL